MDGGWGGSFLLSCLYCRSKRRQETEIDRKIHRRRKISWVISWSKRDTDAFELFYICYLFCLRIVTFKTVRCEELNQASQLAFSQLVHGKCPCGGGAAAPPTIVVVFWRRISPRLYSVFFGKNVSFARGTIMLWMKLPKHLRHIAAIYPQSLR